MKKTGTLKNGFQYEYDDSVFHKMRFIDAVADSQQPDKAYAFSTMVVLLLGEDQREALYEYIEAKGEDVTVEMMGDIIQEITDQENSDVKNL